MKKIDIKQLLNISRITGEAAVVIGLAVATIKCSENKKDAEYANTQQEQLRKTVDEMELQYVALQSEFSVVRNELDSCTAGREELNKKLNKFSSIRSKGGKSKKTNSNKKTKSNSSQKSTAKPAAPKATTPAPADTVCNTYHNVWVRGRDNVQSSAATTPVTTQPAPQQPAAQQATQPAKADTVCNTYHYVWVRANSSTQTTSAAPASQPEQAPAASDTAAAVAYKKKAGKAR